MAHAYTPGLRVSARARLARERRLPLPGEVRVAEGDPVEATTIVASTHLPGEVATLHVANQLGVDPSDLPAAMLVPEGGTVDKDQVIARGGGFLGMFRSEVRSTMKGTVESVSKVTGQVLLRGLPRPLTVDAYIRGRVAAVIPGEGVTVATEGAFIQGIFGIGGEARGPVRVLAASPGDDLDPARLDPGVAGAVVVGGAFASLAAIRRAIEVRAAALVVGGVAYDSLTALLGKPIGVAVTGSETVGITLVVTEGFGHIPIAARTFQLLKENDGREASVNGATQIRAGVIRPEIVVPIETAGAGALPEEREPGGVEVGSAVRIIREPYFGRLGRVTALPAELRSLETETRARVAEVDLGDGARAVVPRSNLELLEA